MKQFSQLGISAQKSFVGESVTIESVLDREIIVNDFKIKDSTKKPGTECLWLQITKDEKQHVIFSGSTFLMDQLKSVKDEDKPFKATIVKINRHFEFK